MKFTTQLLAAAIAAASIGAVQAQTIKVGVTVSATGPAASLGIPEKQHLRAAAARRIGGEKVEYIDPRRRLRHRPRAVKNTRKLDHRGQGRRHRRLHHHAELAGDDRRRRRGRDADDLDGGLRRASSSRSTPSSAGCSRRRRTTQQMATAIVAHMIGDRRQDGRLHRLCRRLRRRLAGASSTRSRESARHEGRRQRALPAQRHRRSPARC
ncbi:MAG: hypothetical protein MZV49_09525 [Rhodopseudomonas palustris]|nr:hypothetical protein [Rhodopseudomonas palustris]